MIKKEFFDSSGEEEATTIFKRIDEERVNGIDSEINGINIDVPQGSCLNPLLCIIYINDLPQTVLDSPVSM